MWHDALGLTKESKELATIVMPYGKFQYSRMAMSLKPLPNFAQSLLKQVLVDLDVSIFIDNIAIFSDNYDEHLYKVHHVLKCLEENKLRVNPLKCKWAVTET